jgi:hypothetical protein
VLVFEGVVLGSGGLKYEKVAIWTNLYRDPAPGHIKFRTAGLLDEFKYSLFFNGLKRGFLGWIKYTIQLLWPIREGTEARICRNET